MKIAVPTVNGELSPHFGHCENFELIDINEEEKSIVAQESVRAPDHQPGLLPKWLKEKRADMVIVGGIGKRAIDLLESHGIETIAGVMTARPLILVHHYLEGSLVSGESTCDHDH